MRKRGTIVLMFFFVLLVTAWRPVSVQHNGLHHAYTSSSDSLLLDFLSKWKYDSQQYAKLTLSFTDDRTNTINDLIAFLFDNVPNAFDSMDYRVVPDSIPVWFYEKNWNGSPQTMQMYPSGVFTAYGDSNVLFLTPPYEHALLSFLDSGFVETIGHLRGDSVIPPRLKFLDTHLAIRVDKRGTFGSEYYSELEQYRSACGINLRFAWNIETSPFVNTIYLKKNCKEAYVCLNRFSEAQVIQCIRRKNKWIIIADKNGHR
jgi:hypothetical protein